MMTKKEDRFIKIYKQGKLTVNEIWIDRETGVNYLCHSNANGGCGITPLLDREGKPIISTIYYNE